MCGFAKEATAKTLYLQELYFLSIICQIESATLRCRVLAKGIVRQN